MMRHSRSSLLAGVVLAVFAALLVDHGGHLGLGLTRVALLGAALGAALGLVPDRAPGWRAGAFLIGFAASWVGYGLRAGLLPDIPMGRAVAAALVILVVTAAAVLSAGRLPLWAGLVGVAALAGAYETTFSTAPTAFTNDSVAAATTALLAAAVGFLASSLVGEVQGAAATTEDAPAPRQTSTPPRIESSGIDIVRPTKSTEA